MSKSTRKEKPDDHDDGDDEKPWDEDQWEAFMKEGDLRAARFGEILETVMDDPDRDRIVARHMGWTWVEEALDEKERAAAERRDAGEGNEDEGSGDDDEDGDNDDDDFDPGSIMEEAAAEEEAEKAEAERLGIDPMDAEEEEDERNIPCYKLANEVGMRVHEALQPYMKARAPKDPDAEWDRDEVDERMGEAYIGCMIAAAKVIGGHAMGYEDEVICGNIANCKRGLAGADQCEAALLWLKEHGHLPAELADSLLPDVRAVQQAVRDRIQELRARVWW